MRFLTKRTVVLGALIAVGSLSIGVTAYQVPQAPQGRGGAQGPRVVTVEKLKDNLFVLRGGGGNTAVFVQANGVTVVDTKNPGWGQPILDAIKEITPKPVTLIVNTHTHGDHVSGNVEFPATVDVVVQANTAANMKKMAAVTGMGQPGAAPPPNIFEQNGGRGLPKRTFTDTMTIGQGADRIDLFYFGRGHTNGDAWILFPSLRVVHAGDIFASNTGLPLLDTNNGGSGVELPATLTKAHAALNTRADAIITGHSGTMTFGDLRAFADFNLSFLNAVRDGKKAGQTVDAIASGWTAPAGITAQPARVRGNVESIYNELK